MSFLLIIIILFSCNKKEDNHPKKNLIKKLYIISLEERKLKEYEDSLKNSTEKILLPRKGFYGENNMLIDKSGNVFFFQEQYIGAVCGTGMENDTLPKFLDLQPEDLIKIPKQSLEKFINENVMSKPEKRRILIIASQNDTIKDKAFLKFYYNLKVPIYFIRRTTQEEDTVLQYKKTDKHYFSDEIKWDKTKIKLRN